MAVLTGLLPCDHQLARSVERTSNRTACTVGPDNLDPVDLACSAEPELHLRRLDGGEAAALAGDAIPVIGASPPIIALVLSAG